MESIGLQESLLKIPLDSLLHSVLDGYAGLITQLGSGLVDREGAVLQKEFDCVSSWQRQTNAPIDGVAQSMVQPKREGR
jgi:hypothetical protein